MSRPTHKNGSATPAPDIRFTIVVWLEGKTYVAFAPELDISSCGKTVRSAREHLRQAVTIFLEEASRTGSLTEILTESGFQKRGGKYRAPKVLSRNVVELQVPAST